MSEEINPYQASNEDLKEEDEVVGLTIGGWIYLVFVGLLGLLTSLLAFGLLIRVVSHVRHSSGLYIWTLAIVILSFILLATVVVSVMKRKLNALLTIISSLICLITIWGFPIGIAGFILLLRQDKRESKNH